MTKNDLKNFVTGFKIARNNSTDETALESIYIYPEWKPNTEYSVGDRIRHGEKLYRCVQAHTSQEGWEPDKTPALWTEISIEEFPEWKQPTGVQDAYNTGDKVSHNGSHWASTIDGNVWEPGAVGTESLWVIVS